MSARSIAANFLFSTLLLGAAGASFAVDSVTFENYAPASSVTRQTFSCIGSATPEVDVEFYTFIEKPGHRESRLKTLTIKGRKMSAEQLAEVNQAVGPDNITGAMAGCSSDGIRVVLNIYRASLVAEGASMEEAQGYLHIYLHKGETAISLK